MIQAIISDFSWVILFPKNKSYHGELNTLYKTILKEKIIFNIYDYFYLNNELLSFYKGLKRKTKIVIFTGGTLQEHPQIQEKLAPIFDAIFSSEYLHILKSDSKSYQLICKKINSNPKNTLFIDDTEKNIKAAKQAGLQTILFQDTAKTLQVIATM